MDFQGKTVLITGATSGIGAATARAFAGEGGNVVLSGRNEARLQGVHRAVEAAGAESAVLIGDVRDAAFCRRLVESAVDRFGGLDILVNNAGVIHCETIEETSDEHWRETMATNVDAVFFMSRAALGPMRRQGRGVIVNVASDAGIVGVPKMGAYCASKGAVVLLTKAMALDHAREGIRVNAVCPNVIETPMLEAVVHQSGLAPAEGRRIFADENPMNVIGEPEEVAHAILYLASDKARFVTGAAFLIDGEYTAG